MTPIEQAAQVLRELIALQAIKDKYAHARPDSPRHPRWEQYLVDVEGFFERQIVAWESARAALASLEAAKQEPGWKLVPVEITPEITAVIKEVAPRWFAPSVWRSILDAAAPSPGSGT